MTRFGSGDQKMGDAIYFDARKINARGSDLVRGENRPTFQPLQ